MATFSGLPIELVHHIWSFLEHDPAGKRHLCTAVVPVVRHHKFATTRIGSTKHLQQFSALVERRDPFLVWPACVQSVGTCVRWLTLPRVEIYDGCDQDASRKALVSVRRILRYCSEIARLTFEAESGTPLSQGHFVRLRRFPALRILSIEVEWEGDEDEAFGTVHTSRPRATGASPITDLTLCGGESLGTPGAALFIADFAQLTHLELAIRDHVDLGPILQACPVTLTSLTIHLAGELEGEEIEPVHVEADLARLVLESGTHLAADKVLNFVLARGGPSRRLETVVLDSMHAHWFPLPSAHPDYPGVENGTFDFRREWLRPKWTASFRLADAHELLAAAKRVGVVLEGSTVQAVEYDEVLAREEAYLQTRRDDILFSLRNLFEELEV